MAEARGRDVGPGSHGRLRRNKEAGLNKKLHEALETLMKGNTETAAEQLRDFVVEVEGLVESGALSEEEGRDLSREAEALIAKLEATVPEP